MITAGLIGMPIVPTIIFSDSFIVVLVTMSVGGISSAFVSGTDVAILYDSLKELGREQDFKQVIGKRNWYGAVAMAASGVSDIPPARYKGPGQRDRVSRKWRKDVLDKTSHKYNQVDPKGSVSKHLVEELVDLGKVIKHCD